MGLSARLDEANLVQVKYDSLSASNGVFYVVALVEKEAVTMVTRGENDGKKLRHINIIRQFEVSKPNAASLVFKLSEKNPAEFFVVVMKQDELTGAIKGFHISGIQ